MRVNEEFPYHEPKRNKPYFEGWYYKIQQPSITCAIIIGIHQIAGKMIGFIQFLRDGQETLIYETYEEAMISFTKQPFQLRMKDNVFDEFALELHLDEHNIHGHFVTGAWTPLENTMYMPTIMGPFAYLKMECNHALISLHHDVRGMLTIDHQRYEIAGTGYMEKDWGTSFPKTYIWFQSNKQSLASNSFFLAVAHIPIMFTSFTGIICVLMVEHKQQRFASYLGAHLTHKQIERKQDEVQVTLHIKQGRYRLEIILHQIAGAMVLAPKHGEMNLKIHESLNSFGAVRVLKHQEVVGEYLFEAGGLEIVGYDSDMNF